MCTSDSKENCVIFETISVPKYANWKADLLKIVRKGCNLRIRNDEKKESSIKDMCSEFQRQMRAAVTCIY